MEALKKIVGTQMNQDLEEGANHSNMAPLTD